ncbi:MAG: DUF6062 family protein [Oscillospiraceae bacterium]|nr:DUF6062 family protein [Oscillospiraceae bacterium]
MVETIYTIPVNEAFDLYSGCPVCSLYKKLEETELETILGGAMMEPDIRIETNKKGFCGTHYGMMFEMKNRLGLALIIESHLSLGILKTLNGGLFDSGKGKKLEKQSQSCYICGKIEHSLTKMLENAAYLWEREKEFREKLSNQPYFCLGHYADLLYAASCSMPKKRYAEFAGECDRLMAGYCEKLLADVTWFTKKFDYRNENEPWGDSKDAVERAIRFLSGARRL